ncbi:arylformamidase, partial [Pseudomonas fluorescens]
AVYIAPFLLFHCLGRDPLVQPHQVHGRMATLPERVLRRPYPHAPLTEWIAFVTAVVAQPIELLASLVVRVLGT